MCDHPQRKLGKTIMASGRFHVWERCLDCGQNANGPSQYLGQRDIDTDNLPTFADYSDQGEPCAVCGAVGTELHHWGPAEHFPETFEQWPKSYLCPQHHQEWHNKLTIPLRALRRKR